MTGISKKLKIIFNQSKAVTYYWEICFECQQLLLFVLLKKENFYFYNRKKNIYLPKLFRCLKVRVSIFDADGIFNFQRYFFSKFNLKDKKNNKTKEMMIKQTYLSLLEGNME
jgi:hypothetical protein